jgi:peptidoglycan/xylan/chitin deacetylase (PgdA/CDA1 family)
MPSSVAARAAIILVLSVFLSAALSPAAADGRLPPAAPVDAPVDVPPDARPDAQVVEDARGFVFDILSANRAAATEAAWRRGGVTPEAFLAALSAEAAAGDASAAQRACAALNALPDADLTLFEPALLVEPALPTDPALPGRPGALTAACRDALLARVAAHWGPPAALAPARVSRSGIGAKTSAGPWPRPDPNLEPCPGNPEALGVHRVLEVETRGGGAYGTVEGFPPLPLEMGEIVLTFDDGPSPVTTRRVLDALDHHCTKAGFYMIGRNMRAHPEIVADVYRRGHLLASHTSSHAYLRRISHAGGIDQIERGLRDARETLALMPRVAALGHRSFEVAPFFRFPGLENTPALIDHLKAADMVIFSCDICTRDWRRMPADDWLRETLSLIESRGRGIVIMHDIQRKTAAKLPELLDALAERNFRIVHVVPKDGRALQPLDAKARVSLDREGAM